MRRSWIDGGWIMFLIERGNDNDDVKLVSVWIAETTGTARIEIAMPMSRRRPMLLEIPVDNLD